MICKQLGYSRGSARVSAYFGEGSGLILLDNVNCNGGESSIFDCRLKTLGEHDCQHKEDAGVVCTGESSKGIQATRAIIFISVFLRRLEWFFLPYCFPEGFSGSKHYIIC